MADDLRTRLTRRAANECPCVVCSPLRNPDGPEAAARIEALESALRELVSRFDRRDWILSGDDSKALHYARNALKGGDNG